MGDYDLRDGKQEAGRTALRPRSRYGRQETTWCFAASDFRRDGKGVQGGKTTASAGRLPAEARGALGAPLAWLLLVGLRPRIARLRFTRQLKRNQGMALGPPPESFFKIRVLTPRRLWVTYVWPANASGFLRVKPGQT